ncbi:MAG: nucleotidyltransferase domain-containing protein [Nitrospinae bacterium]|nr:nucleotidyltransferase domain-containing protein [Nitrospinota bacterium]
MDIFKTHTIAEDAKRRIITTIKDELENCSEIIFAYIFGSFIDTDMPFFRDVDIGIYVTENIVPQKRFIDYSINLSLKLESLLKRFSVDVVVLNNAPLSLAFRITQGVLLFTKNDALWSDFAAKTWSLYNDHAISSRGLLAEILKP